MIAWRRWAKEFGDELGVRFPGELRWAESKEAGSQLTTLVERAIGRGYPARYLPGAKVSGREPAARPRDVGSMRLTHIRLLVDDFDWMMGFRIALVADSEGT